MANLPEEIRQVSLTHKERFRSPSEITAKYNLGLQKYHQMMSQMMIFWICYSIVTIN